MPEQKWWMQPFIEAYITLSHSANESGNIPLSEVLTYWRIENEFVPRELFTKAIYSISSTQQRLQSDKLKRQREKLERDSGRNRNDRHKGKR